jgi:HEPN domain-containing protein
VAADEAFAASQAAQAAVKSIVILEGIKLVKYLFD